MVSPHLQFSALTFSIKKKLCVEPPAGQLRFADPTVANFTADLLSAVADMFPSQLISTGGDEINTHCYDVDQQTQQIFNSTGQTFNQSLNAFTQTTHGALANLGKTPVV